ncbi:PspA/IM30 family protein [Rummeliibacillus pycnus]|uniref:PspA/IM30 family protein n=1 Tax=Rummeliibacillus pycnus TaxID=101070 RepID=UPI000C9B464B|nr:PspA/IM30 family protein [Rummeliibacillus pycnus]
MVNLLQRLKYTIEADLHHLFDKKEEKNPIAMLNQYIREAEKQTEETGKWLERQATLKQKLEKELEETKKMHDKRSKQLDLAKLSGEQDLIDFAEHEILAYEQRSIVLRNSIDKNADELFGLERKYEEMKHKIKDMKVRQLQLMGKENVVRAHNQMDHILHPETTGNINDRLDTFETMENYIERLGQKIDHQHEVTSMEERLTLLEQKTTKKETQDLA